MDKMAEKEYIRREAVTDKLTLLRDKCGNDEMAFALNWALKLMDNIPAADVEPVRHGKWIKLGVHHGMEQYKCSECNVACYVPEIMGEPMYEGCPICRAKMDGGEKL